MGGMEDYYIAQFFCWREIILLNLEIDIETFSSVNLAKAGVMQNHRILKFSCLGIVWTEEK